jgi:hypothetical protein
LAELPAMSVAPRNRLLESEARVSVFRAHIVYIAGANIDPAQTRDTSELRYRECQAAGAATDVDHAIVLGDAAKGDQERRKPSTPVPRQPIIGLGISEHWRSRGIAIGGRRHRPYPRGSFGDIMRQDGACEKALASRRQCP